MNQFTNLPDNPCCLPWVRYETQILASAQFGTKRPETPCSKTKPDQDCKHCPIDMEIKINLYGDICDKVREFSKYETDDQIFCPFEYFLKCPCDDIKNFPKELLKKEMS